MNWAADEDFERDLMAYTEIETLQEPATESIPQTLLRYQQRIQSNNTGSIFDADYTLPVTNGDHSFDDIPETKHEGLLKDDKQLTYVTSGRGRGGRNLFYKPGDPIKARSLDDDQAVIQQIRKVAPIGYGNEITEFAVQAHHKAKNMEQQKSEQTSPADSKSNTPAVLLKSSSPAVHSESSSPAVNSKSSSPAVHSKSSSPALVSKSNSPGTLQNATPIDQKIEPEEQSKSSISSVGASPRMSIPSSRSSDIESSEYFTTVDQNTSSSPQKDETSDEENRAQSEEEESVKPDVIPNGRDIEPPAEPETNLPLSEILKRAKVSYNQTLQVRRNAIARKNYEDELATRRKIREILRQDEEEEMKRKEALKRREEEEDLRRRFSDRSSNSSGASSSSREDLPSWRQRTNSPPRYNWQRFRKKDREMVNINSVMEFPPLN